MTIHIYSLANIYDDMKLDILKNILLLVKNSLKVFNLLNNLYILN